MTDAPGLREAASRYRAAEWRLRIEDAHPATSPEHNANVEEWRAADAALAAILGERSPYRAGARSMTQPDTRTDTREQAVGTREALPCDGFSAGNAWGPCAKCDRFLQDHEPGLFLTGYPTDDALPATEENP